MRASSSCTPSTRGSPTSWRDFSALKFYFETQPLPHVGAWYAHQLAPWLLKAGVGFTFFAELIVPFFIFLPRPLRVVAAGTTILAQLLIIATSNHNFINLLTILLCLFVLDDRIVARMLPARIRDRRADRTCTDRPGLSSAVPSGVAAVLIMAVSLCVLIEAQSHRPLPRLLDAVAEIAPAFGIAVSAMKKPMTPKPRLRWAASSPRRDSPLSISVDWRAAEGCNSSAARYQR